MCISVISVISVHHHYFIFLLKILTLRWIRPRCVQNSCRSMQISTIISRAHRPVVMSEDRVIIGETDDRNQSFVILLQKHVTCIFSRDIVLQRFWIFGVGERKRSKTIAMLKFCSLWTLFRRSWKAACGGLAREKNYLSNQNDAVMCIVHESDVITAK